MKMRKKSNYVSIVKLRKKLIEQKRLEDYELSHHYYIGIQESFQASRVFFNKIAVIAVKFPAKYHGTLPLTHLSR